MITIEAIAELLMHKDISVAALAARLGSIEDKGTDDFRVKPDDPGVLEISIGIPEGKDASAAPSFVQLYYAPQHPAKLENVVRSCKDWHRIPGNPGASPHLYSCLFPGSTEHLAVNMVATLSGDLKAPESSLQMLILQRSVW